MSGIKPKELQEQTSAHGLVDFGVRCDVHELRGRIKPVVVRSRVRVRKEDPFNGSDIDINGSDSVAIASSSVACSAVGSHDVDDRQFSVIANRVAKQYQWHVG